MRVTLEADKTRFRAGEPVTLQVTVFNDGDEAVLIDHRLLVGPNVIPTVGGQPCPPLPLTIEASFDEQSHNQTMLLPGSFYGRARTFTNLMTGGAYCAAYLLSASDGRVHATGPVDESLLLAAAEPLQLVIDPK